MLVAAIMVGAALVLGVGGYFYSGWIARLMGEDASQVAPSVAFRDGRDYVPSPTPVVFSHHYASIAGAGPIIGPVFGLIYGWVPALLWLVFGALIIGAVHDFAATHMAMREKGQSIAVVAREALGPVAFGLFVFLVIVALVLVTATFLNASAAALTSMVGVSHLELPDSQTHFRTAEVKGETVAIVGGIASMSVIIITALAPLIGFLYLKRNVSVWFCSLLAVVICILSIVVGFGCPVSVNPKVWKLLLSGYVLIATGLPVWIFLQSRDFINVHILYVGMALLFTALIGSAMTNPAIDLPAVNVTEASRTLGMPFWPFMFITIACGAVSGFHSLCASGTTCKQLPNDLGARRVGYYAMILESFLAVAVVCACLIGLKYANYGQMVYPTHFGGAAAKGNWILAFGVAVGKTLHLGLHVPLWLGVVGGMLLIEGFLVTTLDTAIRLNRYLFYELWSLLFKRYTAFGGQREASGALAGVFWVMKTPWFNAALAVGLMLAMAWGNTVGVIWKVFGATNQLLAALALLIATAWLMKRGRQVWYVFAPGLLMLATTITALVLMIRKFYGDGNLPLLISSSIVLALSIGIGVTFVVAVARAKQAAGVGGEPAS